MAGAGPPMLNAAYNANYQIVQAPGYVMILTEMIHDVRIIPLDGRPAPHRNVRQWMGVSRGRWEGNTLVVETTNFNGKNPLEGSSENMRVTERFTRVADDAIQYTFTVDDPSTWTRAVDRGDADADDRRAAVRARLSRRELRLVQHARRRPARREEGRRGCGPGAKRQMIDGTNPMRNRFMTVTDGRRASWRRACCSRRPRSPAQAPAYRAPRTPDGKPNLNGIWQAMNTANWDVEAHSAGPSLVRELGAIAAVPAGLGVVEGGEIPYRPEALAKKRNENRANRLKLDPEIKCYLPGVPRAIYMPFPFQIIQSQKHVMIAHEYAGAVRTVYMEKHTEAPADSWMGWSNGHWEGERWSSIPPASTT